MGEKGRAKVQMQSPERVTQDMLAWYRSVCGKSGVRAHKKHAFIMCVCLCPRLLVAVVASVPVFVCARDFRLKHAKLRSSRDHFSNMPLFETDPFAA